MPSDAIVFRQVTKDFGGSSQLDWFINLHKRLKTGSMNGCLPSKDRRPALDSVSFSIKAGERVGIIGPNGAGKSTILKLVNGVVDPSEGEIEVKGSVGCLLEVSAGFHPNLTAYENVILNLTFQGFSRSEALEIVDKVFELADLSNFKHAAFRTLSSGMAVRLGFMSALLSQPDIVLMDEVLAVGDWRFREKCTEMMNSYLEGKTTLFVSHNIPDIREVCNRVLVIYQGKLIFDGAVEDGVLAYEAAFSSSLIESERILPSGRNHFLPVQCEVTSIRFSVDGRITTNFLKGSIVTCEARIAHHGVEPGEIAISAQVKKIEIRKIASTLARKVLRPSDNLPEVVRWEFNTASLLSGDYFFEVTAHRVRQHKRTLAVVHKFPFSITSTDRDLGEGLVDLQIQLSDLAKNGDLTHDFSERHSPERAVTPRNLSD